MDYKIIGETVPVVEKKRFILRSRRLFLPTTKANSSMAKIFVMDRAT